MPLRKTLLAYQTQWLQQKNIADKNGKREGLPDKGRQRLCVGIGVRAQDEPEAEKGRRSGHHLRKQRRAQGIPETGLVVARNPDGRDRDHKDHGPGNAVDHWMTPMLREMSSICLACSAT